ncbi:MAG: CdaR family protein [Clostridium sp.]|uniref:CdaR family protein n=1 Tax=Clostridium sp. TaxID=1506 RepID=UPI003EE5CC39
MDKGSAKERLIIKLVCVLLSFCLWIYVTNVETVIKTYTLKNVPVQVTNTEALKNYGLALVPGQKFTVDLNLEGPSKEVYSVKPSDFIIKADLGEYALKNGVNNIPVQIINYPQQINIKNNGYLVVQVKLEALETKTFDSVSNVTVNFAPNVYKQKINFTSEKIDVTGPQSSVNQVAQVALVGSINDVAGPITKTFKYEPLNANGQVVKNVELSQKEGTIGVETSEGKKVSLEAKFTGTLPNGITLNSASLSQDYAYIIGNKNALANINSLNLSPIDLSEITEDTKKNVNIVVPQGIKVANGNTSVTVSINVNTTNNSQENNNNSNTNNDNNSNNDNNNKTINKNFEIPINYTGINSGLKLENNQSTVNITANGTESLINGLSSSDFTATVDLSSYKEAGEISVTPKITVDKNVAIQSIPNVSIKLISSETDNKVAKNDKK